MVKLALPGGVVESSLKIILLIAATAWFSPPLFVSKRIEPCCGYVSASGTENFASGNCNRLSFGNCSANFSISISDCPNCAAFFNLVGGLQLLQRVLFRSE